MQLCLNVGLTLVVVIGARRVHNGQMEPTVILAFLIYFNMVLQGVMGLNRIFMMLSKASASANRIAQVLETEPDQRVLSPEEAKTPAGDEFIRNMDLAVEIMDDLFDLSETFSGLTRICGKFNDFLGI
jgi:ATP-binding cassette subfamily B protein